MTALIMWILILTSVFITITYFIYTNILNEHVHMLGKKTGVLFTIRTGNFELKQGIEYRALQLLRILRLSPTRARPPALSRSLSLHLNSSVLFLFFSFVVWDPVTNGPLTIYYLTGLLFTQSGRTYQKFRSLAWLALTLCVPRPSADSAVACFLLQCSRCMFCMFFASRIPTCSPSLV